MSAQDPEIFVLTAEDVVQASRLTMRDRIEEAGRGLLIGSSGVLAAGSGIVAARGIEQGNPWLLGIAVFMNAAAAFGVDRGVYGR